jgi:tetratricopeptide (TPR) repeat protein
MKLLYRNILILLLLVFTTGSVFSQDELPAKFKKGVEYYSSSNYQEALKEWTDIYNTGYRSATLDYNIGNAYFKLNNIPGAILFYERALLLKPADNSINYNLQIARSLVVDKFNEIPQLFFVRWFDFLSLLLRTNTWAVFSVISFILFLLLLSVYIYSSRYRLKVLSFWLALLLLIVSASSLAFTMRNKSLVYDSRKAIIFAPSVNGKSSPDNSGTDLFVLHEGSKVSVEDTVGDWYEIKLSDGNKGWVPANSLTII